METKQCKKCGLEKPLNEFGKNKQNKDGLNRWCKICNTNINLKKDIEEPKESVEPIEILQK